MVKKILKQLQDNQEADYDKYYKKSFNSDYIIHPSSKSMPAINIMYINADQFITMKKSELLEFAERITICEVKPKIPRERTELDYVIPGYFLHPVNLDSNVGRVIIAYICSSIDICVIQINHVILTSSLVKYANSKFDYVERIIYFLAAFTEVRILPAHQRKTMPV